MAKKQIFSDRRGGDSFLGGRRPTLDFEGVEGSVRPRKPPVQHSREGSSRPPRDRSRGKSQSRGFSISGVHVAVGFVAVGLAAFFIYYLFFIVPSPIGGLSPAKGNYVKTPVTNIKATFTREVTPSQLALLVDGKNSIMNASIKKKSLSANVPLQDGKHVATLRLDGGGLTGKRTATWWFVVDTKPPQLNMTSKTVTDIKGTGQVKISFKGTTDKGSIVKVDNITLPVDSKGNFEGASTTSRVRSLKISATDSAGNEAASYIVTQKTVQAKGAHVSVYIAGSDTSMSKMIGLVRRTELNALEVDLKDEAGQIGFDLDNPLAKQVGATTKYISSLEGLVDQMRYDDVYAICRVVCFKDPKLGKGRPDLAVQDKAGGVWGKGVWLDPYSKEVWDYDLSIAVAAAKAGFNEIQFDYVRFPSDGNTSTCLYPHQDSRNQTEVIDGYLAYAREKLAPYNVFISADLFGLTASNQGSMGIGQDVAGVSKRIDYISPMVYPSHYNTGEYGIKSPESNPGEIVSKSLKDFKRVMAGAPATLRPWLQDFSLRVKYTPDMVRRQIDATEALGIRQWLLWDPDCTYSETALKK
ncbi:MAG TPA: putative glycoside hydrolase [Candidatus Anoxymicrobiaceae bacterium]